MKSIFRTILCVVLTFCSLNVFAVTILHMTLYCHVSSTPTFPISKLLEVEPYEAGKVLVEEHSDSSGISFDNVIKYKSLETRAELVNKCIEKLGYSLTEHQRMGLGFYVLDKSYSSTNTYFKLEITEDGTISEPSDISIITDGVHSINDSSSMCAHKDNELDSSIKKNPEILRSPWSKLYSPKCGGTVESIYENDFDDSEMTDNSNHRMMPSNFLNPSIDESKLSNIHMYIQRESDELYINEDVYEGDFKDGKMDGEGTLYYKNGDIYEGEFKSGKRDGRGILSFINTRKYVGEFKNDKFHGTGVMVYPDGVEYEGEFQNGKKHGEAILTYPNGSKYKCRFEKGTRYSKEQL